MCKSLSKKQIYYQQMGHSTNQLTIIISFDIPSYFYDESSIKGARCSRVVIGKKEDVEKFAKEIGFSIQRKKRVLESA